MTCLSTKCNLILFYVIFEISKQQRFREFVCFMAGDRETAQLNMRRKQKSCQNNSSTLN